METEVHVARQPIFDVNLNVFGYELMFRKEVTACYDGTDGDISTRGVIVNSFLLIGIKGMTNGKRAFINFTANSLLNGIPSLLPKDFVAVEVLEDVLPSEEIINSCKRLKLEGYLIVLDDFVFSESYMPLIQLADIIKVDFRATPYQERAQLIKRLKQYPIKFLAEKVETQEEFHDAVKMGYAYFQGYFFCKPLILSGKNLPEYKVNYLNILQEINKPELHVSQIEEIIKRDVSLSYKLLKFINSPIFGFRNKINSLRQAITLLGQKELAKWVSLITLNGVAIDKPSELILESLIRARFGERLALLKMSASLAANVFLMGMFSHIDVLLNRPLQNVLNEISLAEDIKNALLDKEHNQFSVLYKLICSYEKGDWDNCTQYVAEMGIKERDVLDAYRDSLKWAHELLVCNDIN